MSELYFDLASLEAKADELETLNETFFTEVQNLDDTEAALGAMWEGPANEAFRAAYARDAIQMRNFYNCIKSYVSTLRAIVENYRRYEQMNETIATNRTY